GRARVVHRVVQRLEHVTHLVDEERAVAAVALVDGPRVRAPRRLAEVRIRESRRVRTTGRQLRNALARDTGQVQLEQVTGTGNVAGNHVADSAPHHRRDDLRRADRLNTTDERARVLSARQLAEVAVFARAGAVAVGRAPPPNL